MRLATLGTLALLILSGCTTRVLLRDPHPGIRNKPQNRELALSFERANVKSTLGKFRIPFFAVNHDGAVPWQIRRSMFTIVNDWKDPVPAFGGVDYVIVRIPPRGSAIFEVEFPDRDGTFYVRADDPAGAGPVLMERLTITEYTPAWQVLRLTVVVLALLGIGAIA